MKYVILAIMIFLLVACSTTELVPVTTSDNGPVEGKVHLFVHNPLSDNASVDDSQIDTSNVSDEAPPIEPVQTPIVSAVDLATHNLETDCWVGYNGKVYDVTAYIGSHPGEKDKIIPNCGTSTQFEEAFSDQQGQSQIDALVAKSVERGDLVE